MNRYLLSSLTLTLLAAFAHAAEPASAVAAPTVAPSAAPAAAGGWAQPQPAPAALVQGVGVPVKVNRGRGTIRLQLWLPAECAASPAALNAALDDLERAGLPLDVYEPKDSGWGGGNSFNRGWRK